MVNPRRPKLGGGGSVLDTGTTGRWAADPIPRKDLIMRVRTPTVIVVALVGAGAMALAGTALGGASSTATFTFTPSTVPKDTFRKGSLFVHTHTNYTAKGTKTARAQLDFDDDLRINTQGIPRCSP